MNVTVEVDISVRGAALGGLQRYVVIHPLEVKEGGQVPITTRNINFSAVTDFISMQHRGKYHHFSFFNFKGFISETYIFNLINKFGVNHWFIYNMNNKNQFHNKFD